MSQRSNEEENTNQSASLLIRAGKYVWGVALNKMVEASLGAILLLVGGYLGFQKYGDSVKSKVEKATAAETNPQEEPITKTEEIGAVVRPGNIGYLRKPVWLGASSKLEILPAGEHQPPFNELLNGEHDLSFTVHSITKSGGIMGFNAKTSHYLVELTLSAEFDQTSYAALLRDGEENFLKDILLSKVRESVNSSLPLALSKLDENKNQEEQKPSSQDSPEIVTDGQLKLEDVPPEEQLFEPAKLALAAEVGAKLGETLKAEYGLKSLSVAVNSLRTLNEAEVKADEVSSLEKVSAESMTRVVLEGPAFAVSQPTASGIPLIAIILLIGALLVAFSIFN